MSDSTNQEGDQAEVLIESEVFSALQVQQDLDALQNELMADERFKRFLELSKKVPAQLDQIWKNIEQHMIDANVKSVKGDWGSITIAERINWDYDPTVLSAKFFKKVVDTKKLSDTFKLEGKEPKGATAKYTKYLTKRLK